MSQDLDFSTPMMQQYLALKQQYADCLLWFRLGDFYEMFLDHAEIGSRVLGITLTSRARGKDGRVPMAGIPYHAAEAYLAKLVKAGYKVAICEQLTLPQPGKTLVERDVIRIVTPGTALSDLTLQQKRNNYIWAVITGKNSLSVALTDISTGELRLGAWENQSPDTWPALLQKLADLYPPSEFLLAPSNETSEITQWIATLNQKVITRPGAWESWSQPPWPSWSPVFATELGILAQLSSGTKRLALGTVSVLLNYLEYTQKTPPTHLQPLQSLLPASYLVMDRSTIANLEIFTTLYDNQQHGSLMETLDETLTAMGGRLLAQWLHKPLADQTEIEERLSLVAQLVKDSSLRTLLRDTLRQVPDLERLVARLNLGVANPRDVLNLARALNQALVLNTRINQSHFPLQLTKVSQKTAETMNALVTRYIEDEPPIDPKVGGLIKLGMNAQLDELKLMVADSQAYLLKLETEERQKTGIATLKIKYNSVFGYYIEVSNSNLANVPSSYMRKQTLVNAERFITPELKVQEEIILTAQEKIIQLEFSLFQEVCQRLIAQTSTLQQIAATIAQIDCLGSLAEAAVTHHYRQPRITTDGRLELQASRHPVLEHILPTHRFVPNDVALDTTEHQVMLLTGPNMAGKSVLMRQVALITLMAHVGSFVPAEKAEISLTDRIFVRSGASDMITRGLSTFMVEMVETAEILRHATDHSLVVMDEIGRGTSTYDGISLAWAIAEELVTSDRPHPKTLFATHYHELQALADKFPDRIHNFHLSVKETKGKLVFLYTLTAGGSAHSHGVAVAELAGLPNSVIQRAKQLLTQLERPHISVPNALPPKHQPAAKTSDASLLSELHQLQIENVTPLTALNLIATWKQIY